MNAHRPATAAAAAVAGTNGASSHNDVVVVLLDGSEVHGTVANFNPRLPTFFVNVHGDQQRIAFDSVKSIAFQRGDGTKSPQGGFSGNARLVTVRFRDGSTLDGVAENVGGPRCGVFLVPVTQEEIDRMYIPVSAVGDMASVQRLSDLFPGHNMVSPGMVAREIQRQVAQRPKPENDGQLRRRASDRVRPAKPLPPGQRRCIGEILFEQGCITREELDGALQTQKRERDKKLGQVMTEMGYTSYKMIAIALAIQYNVPFVSLSNEPVDPSLRDLMRREEAATWQMLPLKLEKGRLTVAIADPSHTDFKDTLQRRSGAVVTEVLATPQDIQRAMEALYTQEEARRRAS